MKLIALFLGLILANATLAAELKLAGLFTDHMVLQRETAAPVWGWAAPGESISVEFAGQKKSATADADGKWLVKLDAMPAIAAPRWSRRLDLTGAWIKRRETNSKNDFAMDLMSNSKTNIFEPVG